MDEMPDRGGRRKGRQRWAVATCKQCECYPEPLCNSIHLRSRGGKNTWLATGTGRWRWRSGRQQQRRLQWGLGGGGDGRRHGEVKAKETTGTRRQMAATDGGIGGGRRHGEAAAEAAYPAACVRPREGARVEGYGGGLEVEKEAAVPA
uniref:Uncharacterized protein n=1 Tax=Oryza brachyantha TaxID=4533 RepID=J3M5B4_ORYBR